MRPAGRQMVTNRGCDDAKTVDRKQVGDHSTNETAVVQPTLLFRLVILLLREGVPEPESLVAGASHDGFSLWTHREVQNTMGVTSQRGDHVERWILPDADLVLGGR